MTVFALVPVFNRLEHTKRVIGCLRAQKEVDVRIVIVDDGSNDGTAAYLQEQADVVTLKGTGNLWWAGAMDLALRHVHPLLKADDYVLFINNDTIFDENFVATLSRVSLANDQAVVGSTIRDFDDGGRLVDIGARSDLSRFAIWDFANDELRIERINMGYEAGDAHNPNAAIKVDFVSGRGALYPAAVLNAIGYLRPSLLPHYLADYEYSARAARAGFPLQVAINASVHSTDDFGNQKKAPSYWRRKFGKGSPENVFHRYIYFSIVGTPYQRHTAIIRLLLSPLGAVFGMADRISGRIRFFPDRVRHLLVCTLKSLLGPKGVAYVKRKCLRRGN